MTYKQAMSKAKKAAKREPGQSFYIVEDEGYEVIDEWALTLACNFSPKYGDRLMAIISYWTAEPGYKAGYEIENYSQGDLVEG